MAKDINLVECSGRLTYKRYDPEENTLFLVVQIALPRVKRGKNDPVVNVMRDAPSFTYRGSDAEELDKKFSVNDMITVTAHASTGRTFLPQGDGLYRVAQRLTLTADDVEFSNGMSNNNTVIIEGTVASVTRNENAHLYDIRIDTVLDNGRTVRMPFTYFDSAMRLEPKKNDRIRLIGSVQVKRTERNGIRRYYTSIVAKTVTMTQRNETPEEAAKRRANRTHVVVNRDEMESSAKKEEQNVVYSEPVFDENGETKSYWDDAEDAE